MMNMLVLLVNQLGKMKNRTALGQNSHEKLSCHSFLSRISNGQFALTIEKHVNQQGNTDCIFNVSVWFTYYPSAVNPLMNMSLIIFIVWNVTSVPPFFIVHVLSAGCSRESLWIFKSKKTITHSVYLLQEQRTESNKIHLARLNSSKVLAIETLSQFIVLQCIIEVVCRSIVVMVLEILD